MAYSFVERRYFSLPGMPTFCCDLFPKGEAVASCQGAQDVQGYIWSKH